MQHGTSVRLDAADADDDGRRATHNPMVPLDSPYRMFEALSIGWYQYIGGWRDGGFKKALYR